MDEYKNNKLFKIENEVKKYFDYNNNAIKRLDYYNRKMPIFFEKLKNEDEYVNLTLKRGFKFALLNIFQTLKEKVTDNINNFFIKTKKILIKY